MPAPLRLSLLTLIVLSGGCGATVGKFHRGVPNLATVDPEPEAIYRGGQPTKAGFKTLRDMGVKTVIDLRDDAVPWEKSAVTKAGMTYVHIPSNAARTNATTIASFLTAVTEAERPIYVHCRRGRDRTGLEVACYRLVYQQDKWTRDKAIEDLRAHGHQRIFFPGIERYLRTFNPQDFTPMPKVEAAVPTLAAPQGPAGG